MNFWHRYRRIARVVLAVLAVAVLAAVLSQGHVPEGSGTTTGL